MPKKNNQVKEGVFRGAFKRVTESKSVMYGALALVGVMLLGSVYYVADQDMDFSGLLGGVVSECGVNERPPTIVINEVEQNDGMISITYTTEDDCAVVTVRVREHLTRTELHNEPPADITLENDHEMVANTTSYTGTLVFDSEAYNLAGGQVRFELIAIDAMGNETRVMSEPINL